MSDKICIGKAVSLLCKIKILYNRIHCLIQKAVTELNDLATRIAADTSIGISKEFNKEYTQILKNLRCNFEHLFNDSKCEVECECDLCLTKKCSVLSFKVDCRKILVNLPKFLAYFYLQRTSKCHEYLYYNVDPDVNEYNNAKKKTTTLKEITIDNVYPVWYFKHNNSITTNYTYIAEKVGGTPLLTYSGVLYKRLLLKDCYADDDKQSVIALGKYKFSYKQDDSGLIFPGILPEEQGVTKGIYSFAGSLDHEESRIAALTTLTNTVLVLQQLIQYIELFINDLSTWIDQFCSC